MYKKFMLLEFLTKFHSFYMLLILAYTIKIELPWWLWKHINRKSDYFNESK